MSEKTIAEQIKEAEDSEGAEKKRNQAIVDAVNKAWEEKKTQRKVIAAARA